MQILHAWSGACEATHPLDERIESRDAGVNELGDLCAQLLHDAGQRALQHPQLKGQLPVYWGPAVQAQDPQPGSNSQGGCSNIV